MQYTRATVADGQAGQELVAAASGKRVIVYGFLMTFSAVQSPRLENTDGTTISQWRSSTFASPIFVPPQGGAKYQSEPDLGLQLDTAWNAADTGITEIDLWYDYIDSAEDIFAK
jgi:hypothetical protein